MFIKDSMLARVHLAQLKILNGPSDSRSNLVHLFPEAFSFPLKAEYSQTCIRRSPTGNG